MRVPTKIQGLLVVAACIAGLLGAARADASEGLRPPSGGMLYGPAGVLRAPAHVPYYGRTSAVTGFSNHNMRFNNSPVIYDSLVVNQAGYTSSYIYSEGFECCSTKEFGDGLIFTSPNARIKYVWLVMNSWACESGTWWGDNCQTTPGAKFSLPITMNIYSVANYPSGPFGVGSLIATRTQTFSIPYRPSKNDRICQGPNAGAFLGPVDKECDNGLSSIISFNFSLPKLTLPPAAIITVAFNTSDAGYNPIGDNTACFSTQQGCPYDSLNVSSNGTGGFVGGNVDPNGVVVNYGNPYFYCSGTGSGLVIDTPCWTDYHPEIKVTSF
jgi:hypothetical protein